MISRISQTQAHAAHIHEVMAIHFEFKNEEAASVHVAGSFNEWSAQANPMERGYGGRWSAVTSLAPGTYEYCFVVDGRWILDPTNQTSVGNPFGGRNSVLMVGESPKAAHLIDAEIVPFEVSIKNGLVGVNRGDGPKLKAS